MKKELNKAFLNFELDHFEMNHKKSFISDQLWFFFAWIPVITTLLAVNFQWQPTLSYGAGKVAMLIIPFFFVKSKDVKFNFQWKLIIISTLGLCIAPIVYLSLGFLDNTDPTPLVDKLQSLNLQNHFFLVVLILSFINAPLEEWFYRIYLLDHTPGNENQKSLINGLLFIPHHLAVLMLYFPLPDAILFSFGTGVAGFVWAKMRMKGANFLTLTISHTICDIVVIGLPGYLLLAKSNLLNT